MDEEEFFDDNVATTEDFVEDIAPSGGLSFEKRLERLSQSDRIDQLYGCLRYTAFEERVGWLYNLQPCELFDEDRRRFVSALDLYFIGEIGDRFKISIVYAPYFYVGAKLGRENDVYAYLSKRYHNRCLSCELIAKEDLDLPNHLAGIKRTLIRLRFHDIDDLMKARKELQPIVKRNIEREKEQQSRPELAVLTRANSTNIRSSDLIVDGLSNANVAEKQIDGIIELREFDVPYHIRVCIDLKINVGLWYTVRGQSSSGPENQLSLKPDLIEQPEPVILAFDIECTKMPLKFPSAATDQIMMISYMIDTQGYLIINREIISQDIEDFEYTPKKEYPGHFHVFNEANEFDLLKRFFNHITDVKPHILVTYNGDSFDIPFVEQRAQFYGLSMFNEIGFRKDSQDCYLSRPCVHMDCIKWVKRDSYLPVGSHGLKAVTKAKLRYNPIEIDPEDMCRLAVEQPQTLSNYSVSDAVATYYLYMKYVHTFIFALGTIIPMRPDEVLRKGSGTLCETLLMVQAYSANVIYPNKHEDEQYKYTNDGHLLVTETYVGASVEALESGVFRSDIPCRFKIVPETIQYLIDNIDRTLQQSIEVEEKLSMDLIENLDEIKEDIIQRLQHLKNVPNRLENPNIYHLDVGAMYPNIILTNRLQPSAIVDSTICAQCDLNRPNARCQRKMDWIWRGTYVPATRNELQRIQLQLENERFQFNGQSIEKKHFADQTKKDFNQNSNTLSFHELSQETQISIERKRLADYCRKAYKKVNHTREEIRETTVCQCENSFYVDTVRAFRDRRYEYKGLHKKWKKNLTTATKKDDLSEIKRCNNLIVIYDSLQLAHKCILNSFYGYVMRRGARWHRMEMGGIVCTTGSTIIKRTRELIEQIGRPLELDTDGIWCVLPATFPENYELITRDPSRPKVVISYPCSLLNLIIKDHYTNDQYHELVDKDKHAYDIRSENSIFFEIDGPYLAMILPASKEEGKRIKKRYCVFNMDGTIAELKGFEVKRNGELQLIKIFQASVFDAFLKGATLEECYNHVATIADYWLDMLYSHAKDISDKELFELISERRTMSRMLSDYGEQKSTSISTAKRLAEFLGEDVIKDKGLCCRFVIANVPRDAPVTERAIPLAIFQSEQSIRNHYLRKWLRLSSVDNLDIRDILDWNYYIERFNSCIQKIITIPAALQNIRNPVPRVSHPDWLHKRLVEKNSLYKQKRITDVFNSVDKQTNHEQQLSVMNDIEDIANGQTKSSIVLGKKTTAKVVKRKRDEMNDKTLTRQWRVVLGPPPTFGHTTGEHVKWLTYQKRKWDIQREQSSSNTNDNSQTITKPKAPNDGKIDTYIRRAAEHLHARPWQIISYELTDQPGVFKAWCLVDTELAQIKIKVPRIFYVNYRIPFDEQTRQTQYSADYERTVHNCAQKVNRLLPRCSQAYFLYEYRLDETHFQDYYTDIMTDLSNPNIEGVYEMNVPLDFRLLTNLGCICSLRKEHYRVNPLSNLYQFDELEFLNLSEQTYLQPGTMQCIYLYIHQDSNKLFIGLFIPNSCRVFIGILDSIRENHMPNLNKLLKNECEKRLQRGIDTNLLPINEHQFEIKVETDSQSIWKRFNKIISNLKENDMASRTLPIYIAIQSNISLVDLQSSMLSSLADYPKVTLAIKDKPNLYKSLDWQRTAARHALQHYANANIILVNMLEQCRYLHIPIGNFPEDPCLFACDLFYARHLIKHNHLLWCSLTDQPDLGGKEQDDYRMLLTADVNHNQQENASDGKVIKTDQENFQSNKQNHPFEINHSGFYPTSCIEFELVGLAICAVLNFQKIHEAEGSNFDLGFGTTVQNPLGGPGVIPSISNTSLTAYDETTQCLPALRLLRQMVQIWLQDVHSYTNIFADMQLNHFYRWLQSTKSLLYEPALKRTIQVFMRKLLVQLLVELQRIGSTTIYGNLNKIILATKRWSLSDTRLYIKVILEHLQMKDLTSTICLELKSIYHCLWWFDDKNYCGFRIWSNARGQLDDNLDNSHDDEEETIFDWNMIVYLPKVVQDYFETIMIGFARSIYDRLRDEYKEVTSINQTNLPTKVFEYCRGLFTDELYQQLMSVTNQIERKLTKSDFDETLPTPLSSTSPALEFVKSVCCLLFLLHDMHDDVLNLRRDLLKLLKLSEYSEMTTTNLSSLTSFVVPQFVCSNCNHYRDIDLYREINSTIDNESDDEQNRIYQYTCNQCHTPYDQTVIEQFLINHLQTLVLENVLQDAICNKCHFVRNVSYKIYCDCGELYQNLYTTRTLNDTCIILAQIASKHQMNAVLQQIQFLNRLNHWND